MQSLCTQYNACTQKGICKKRGRRGREEGGGIGRGQPATLAEPVGVVVALSIYPHSIHLSRFYPSIQCWLSIYPRRVSIYAWFQFWFCYGWRRSLSCVPSVAVSSVTFTCELLLLLLTMQPL